jgi:branched-chain amino acid transport system permease protein
LIALSLVVLTGWSGQVSLGQAAFAGIGALGYGALVNGNPLGCAAKRPTHR